jgi:D-3-phosphoglycerate dehydrogenase
MKPDARRSVDTLRILNAEPSGYSDTARAILRGLGELDEIELDRQDLIGRLPDYDVLIVRLAHSVDRELLSRTDRLKAVVSATTGLDHIDVSFAESRGVRVLSLRGEHEFLSSVSSTAEHAWALLLALVRKVPSAVQHVLSGGWERDRFRGIELQGMRLGLMGLGRVGTIVARYGLAFGMDVTAYDPAPRAWLDGVRPVDTLVDLAAVSDVLSIHVPLNDTTNGIVDRDILSRLPPGSFLINTARAQIVDSPALLDALESGHLAGAALDVLDRERDESGRRADRLIGYSRSGGNLIITPHLGGATVQAMERTEVFMAEKLRDYLAGDQ